MPWTLVRHKVKDYAAWKSVFDEHETTRKAAGSKGGYLFQSADDPNDVTIFLGWDDLAAARKLYQSDDLRQAMEHAGVAGPPEIAYLNDAGQPAA